MDALALLLALRARPVIAHFNLRPAITLDEETNAILTVTIFDRQRGRWYGYQLDAADLKYHPADLALRLEAMHIERVRVEGAEELLRAG